MPPSIVVNNFPPVRIHIHSPSITIISYSRFFITIRRICFLQGLLTEDLVCIHCLVPFKEILRGAVNILIPKPCIEVSQSFLPSPPIIRWHCCYTVFQIKNISVSHLEWCEKLLLEEFCKTHPRSFFNDQSKQCKISVAIFKMSIWCAVWVGPVFDHIG